MQKIIKTVMFVVTATSLLVLSGCSTAGPFVTSISSDGQGGLIVEKAYIEYSPFTSTISTKNGTSTTILVSPKKK